MSAPKIGTDNLDRLFSQLVRARAGWKCERCGAQHQPRSAGLHCSHLFSRRHRATRWEPQNAFAHCFPCHQFLGGNPVLFTDWAKGQLGSDTVDALQEQAMTPTKLTEQDKADIADDLYAKVQALGETPVCTGRKRSKKKAAKKKARAKVGSATHKRKVNGKTVKREAKA